VWLGFIGGVIPSVLKIIRWAQVDSVDRPKSPFSDGGFWILFVLLPLVGGFVVGLYEHFGTKFNGLLAFQVGITAPAFLQQLAATAPALGKTG
jgi:hypothetical protein